MYTWTQIVSGLAQSGPNALARVPVHQMEHPRDAGLRQTFGEPVGQRASYRALLTDGRCLYVEDFGSVYEARLENPPPAAQPSPGNTAAEGIVGLTALGALLGLALGGKRESVITGALLGGISGLAAVAVREAERSPQTSSTAAGLAKAMSSLLPACAVDGAYARERRTAASSSGKGRAISQRRRSR